MSLGFHALFLKTVKDILADMRIFDAQPLQMLHVLKEGEIFQRITICDFQFFDMSGILQCGTIGQLSAMRPCRLSKFHRAR